MFSETIMIFWNLAGLLDIRNKAKWKHWVLRLTFSIFNGTIFNFQSQFEPKSSDGFFLESVIRIFLKVFCRIVGTCKMIKVNVLKEFALNPRAAKMIKEQQKWWQQRWSIFWKSIYVTLVQKNFQFLDSGYYICENLNFVFCCNPVHATGLFLQGSHHSEKNWKIHGSSGKCFKLPFNLFIL